MISALDGFLTIQGEPTVINDDWYGTLFCNLGKEGFQSLPVSRQNAGEVSWCDDNHIICAGLCRLLRQLDGLPSAPGTSPSNDRHIVKPSIIQSLSSGFDQSNSIGVR